MSNNSRCPSLSTSCAGMRWPHRCQRICAPTASMRSTAVRSQLAESGTAPNIRRRVATSVREDRAGTFQSPDKRQVPSFTTMVLVDEVSEENRVMRRQDA